MSWNDDGMVKRIEPDTVTGWDRDMKRIDLSQSARGDEIQKLAFRTHVPERLLDAMRDIKAAPDPRMSYWYDRAMGAGETYGPNNNGDFFSRQDLINRHHTFETVAKLYRHHKSKGPAIGDVVAAAYNYKIDTVDLIIRAPVEQLKGEIERFGRGAKVSTSMGAKVPFDVCSICGHRARRRAHYCSHLKRHMLKELDGRLTYAENPHPTFNDISIVVVGAEPTSMFIDKVASWKSATIQKTEVSMEPPPSRGVVKPDVVRVLGGAMPAEDALATLHYAYGPLRPDEFTAVMRKDASLIRRDVTFFASPVRSSAFVDMGRVHSKYAMLLKEAGTDPCPAKMRFADFMTSEEAELYSVYRRATGTMPGEFLR